MPDLNSITFDLEELRVPDSVGGSSEIDATSRTWFNSFGDELSLHLFSRPPDLSAPLADFAAIRRAYRENVAAHGGGIISLDAVTVAGLPGIVTVFKFPQQLFGMTYVGAITFPFREFSLVVRVICREVGVTGLRDTAVFAKLLAAGTVAIATDGAPELANWAHDPYDPSFVEGSLRNRSDDEEWDVEFTDHPLSRVRRCLKMVCETCRVPAELQAAAPFEGPARRPWWRRLTGG
jgi:hypothetical protein